MEYDSISREIRIDATPEVVFDVVSNPVHVQQWWPDEAHYDAVPGSSGELVFTKPPDERFPVAIQVVDAVPHRLFTFRWTHPAGESPRPDNSLLVTFEIEADGAGSLLRMTETGFQEQNWDAAQLDETYRDHDSGWDYHLARLTPYVTSYLAATP